MKYIVRGETMVYVDFECEAENAEEAREKAADEVWSLTSYYGNGGVDKLVGVYNEDASIYPSDEIEWNDVEKLEESK